MNTLSSSWPVQFFLMLGLLGAACSQSSSTSQSAEAETVSATDPLGSPGDGWASLSGGGDLNQWRGFQQDSLPAGWSNQGSAIHFDPSADGGGDLITKEQFGDFELSLGWKISRGGNSGIIYRVSEDRDRTYKTGPEYQVLDNERHPDAENALNRTAAAAYGLYAPSKDATKPAGQWNRARIVVDSSRVEHWLNGEKAVEYKLGSADWKERVANSKFSDMPGYGQSDRGHIALQDHGNEVWYRNVKVRSLNGAADR